MKEILEDLIDYENGDLSDEETFAFFQKLVDTGLVWNLQESYARTAIYLAEEGYIQIRFDDFDN